MADACGLLERIPPPVPDEEAGLLPDGLFVERRRSPFRDDADDFALEATGGAGGFVSLLRFFPNFFFAVGSDGCCADFVVELICIKWITCKGEVTRGTIGRPTS